MPLMVEELKARRLALGLSREKLADVAEVSPTTLNRIEGGERCSAEHVEAVARALDEIDVELRRMRQFLPVLETKPEPAAPKRARPWPISATQALFDFRAAGVAAGADVVVMACTLPLHVVVGVSPLGVRIVAASTGCGLPADGFAHATVLAKDADGAIETVALGQHVQRVLRTTEVPPMRVMRRVEPAIVGRRDNAGRITLHVAPEPAVEVVAAATPQQRPPRRAPQRQHLVTA